MNSINPSEAAIRKFSDEAVDSKPIIMVNLLKFREVADYGDGRNSGVSGQQAYARYSKAAIPLVWEVGGQVLWFGKVRSTFIAPEGESWDEAALVLYPNRAAFLRMVTSPVYQQAMPHRTAALADSRLIETQAKRLPKAVLALARGVVRIKGLLLPRIP